MKTLHLLALAAALAGCAAQPGPPTAAAPAPVASFNASPLVTGQSPAGRFGTAGVNMSFTPLDSLPPGAANAPVRNP